MAEDDKKYYLTYDVKPHPEGITEEDFQVEVRVMR